MTEDKKGIRAQPDQSEVEGSRSGQSLKGVDLIWVSFLLAAVGTLIFGGQGIGSFLLLIFCVLAVVLTRFVARHLRSRGSFRGGSDEPYKPRLSLPQWGLRRFSVGPDWQVFVASLCLLLPSAVGVPATPQNDTAAFNLFCILVFLRAYPKTQGSCWREYSALVKAGVVFFWVGLFLYAATNQDWRYAIPGY